MGSPHFGRTLRRSSSWSVAALPSENLCLAAVTTAVIGHHPPGSLNSSAYSETEELNADINTSERNCLKNAEMIDQLITSPKEKPSCTTSGLIGTMRAGDDSYLERVTAVSESLHKITWLACLDLSRNHLVELPENLGDLINLQVLDVSENELMRLPSTIAKLSILETLNIHKNKIHELPWGIGQCKSLTKLNGDFNQLKALPDTIGSLSNLKSLSVHLNHLKGLPMNMATMTSLVELDVTFNQLGYIPESLCLVTSLVKLNLASNFSDLKELPQSIGRLRKLRELDISFNHLTSLPDSFALLTNLETLNLAGNPLKLPPLQIAEQGKEAVLNYMISHVEKEWTRTRRRSHTMGLVKRLITRTFKNSRIAKRDFSDILA